MPLQRHAEQMRDMYANEIARTLHRGEQPSRGLVESWAKYDAAVQAGDPASAFRPEPSSTAGGTEPAPGPRPDALG